MHSMRIVETSCFPLRLFHFKELDSTIDYALRNMDELQDGDIILAETQTKGRGRFDRKWMSGIPDNIYMSLVLKPAADSGRAENLMNISQLMSVSVCDIFQTYGISAGLKWPNDVLVDGRKICGLLSRGILERNRIRACVLGVGVNCNMENRDIQNIDQPAVSMNTVLGRSVDRDMLLDRLLEDFFKRYRPFLKQGFSLIHEAYTEKSILLGKTVEVELPGRVITGTAQGFSENGCLIVASDSGEETDIRAGDVRCASAV